MAKPRAAKTTRKATKAAPAKASKRYSGPDGLPPLTIDLLKNCAAEFAKDLGSRNINELYGITDGKAVGTYVEDKFLISTRGKYDFVVGNAASGIDVPGLQIDIKCTSIKQPQSSCPFKNAAQKVFGLGYSLIVFVYDKHDDEKTRTSRLDFQHVIFVHDNLTADYQCSSGVLSILKNDGNKDEIIAFLIEKNLPLDDIGLNELADRIMRDPPTVAGCLTISNALQWRLQYTRAITYAAAGKHQGVKRLF